MQYTEKELVSIAKSTLGAPVILLELDPLAEENALKQAYSKYTEYFSAWRYVTLQVNYNIRTYTLTAPDLTTPFTNEALGTILGGAKTFTTKFADNPPVIKSSLTITAGSITGVDNGLGAITGTGITSGTINYLTGQITLTLTDNVSSDTPVTISYTQLTKKGKIIKDVIDVAQLYQYQPNFWNQWGLLDVQAIKIQDLMVLPMEYNKTVRMLQETSQMMGTLIDWEFYQGQLYLRSFQNGRVAVKCKVNVELEDIKDEHASRFTDIYIGYLKQSMGHIRRKYPTIPIPGSEITLDGAELIAEGAAMILAAEEKFRQLQNKPVFVFQ